MLVGFGRYLVAGASQNDSSSVKTQFNLQLEGTDWCICRSREMTASGGGISTHWFRPVLPVSSYLPRGEKVVLSSRLTEVRLLSNLPVAALTRSGYATAMEVTSFSLPTSTLLRLEL